MTPRRTRDEGRALFLPLALRNFANGRVHWRTEAAYRKRVRLGVALACRAWTGAEDPAAPKAVHLEARVYSLFDDDGLRNACKPIIDGLVDARVLHADGPRSGHGFSYSQVIDRQHRGIRITVEALNG